MSMILSFIPKRSRHSRKKDLSAHRGDVIIFPGVRYERLDECEGQEKFKSKET